MHGISVNKSSAGPWPKKQFLVPAFPLFILRRMVYNKMNDREGVKLVATEMNGTTKFSPVVEGSNRACDILEHVYRALQAKGYDPVTQLVGYIISGDPTYITSYGQARSMICRLERDEIVEELVRVYLQGLDA